YPGAPVPAGAPGSGGGGFFKGRPGIVIAAATAGLLAVGGVTWWAVSGDDDPKAPVAKPSAPATAQEPSGAASAEVDKGDGSGGGRAQDDDLNAGRQPGEAKVEWLVKNDQDLPRNGADVFGPWVVGDTIVKALYRKIEGFSVADGKKKWSIPFQTDICQSAPAPNADGIIVISVKDGTGDRANCRVMQQIDLKSGKAGWKKEIPQDGGPFSKLSEASLAIAGNTVTAAGTGNSYGFSLTDGKQLYGRPDETCKPFAFAGAGARLIGAASCPVDDYANPQHEVWDVDPATGKPKWKYRLKRGWSVDKVYSVSPLVVNVVNNEKKQRAVLALKDDGTQRSQLSSGRDEGFRAECSGGLIVFGENLQDCAGVVADADTFYMATEPTSGLRGTNELVAFDLNTGKPKWRTSAGSERTLVPIRKEGAEVVVYIKPTYDSGGAVATVSATGGKPKVLLQHPSSVARVERDFWSTRYAYAGGRFFLASGRVSAQNDKAELETKTMMAFAK
ncbi:PQQ-binding-like beta-propeller repeat protein, partial [Streptomyces sp. CC77]|uniref:outer membrane protein assembly factor BamB family protein n=1 Tax=Streptomyces sp. CC77 TaxID=1906739 RepID=UPI0008DE2840